MSHLTSEQRYTISSMLAQNYKQNQIALAIGKDKSVVSREIKRNSDQRNGFYKSDLANRKYKQRQEEKNRPVVFTTTIKKYVEDGLNNEYSPEQINGRAKLDGISCVSHECIYRGRPVSISGKIKNKAVTCLRNYVIPVVNIVNVEIAKTNEV
jgi:IS30 family transposase